MRFVSLAAVTTLGLVGCSDPDTNTELRPEGPPEVLQVFVIDNDDVSKLAYGEHPEINDLDGDPDTTPFYADHAGPVNAAFITGNKIRIILDELLIGGTIEQFACACWHHPAPTFPAGTPPGCTTRGFAFGDREVDVNQCSTCEDDLDTPVNETGKCADYNFDETPDRSFLIGDENTGTSVFTVTCDGTQIPIPVENGGFWQPSGNQLIPTAINIDALGPALVVLPPALRSDADCTIEISSTVTDKDGLPVEWPSGAFSFHTEVMTVASTQPANGQTNVDVTLTEISVGFNTDVDPDTADFLIVREAVSGTEVLGTGAVDPADPSSIIFTLDAGESLQPNTEYEIVIPTTILDAFGGAFPAEEINAFTTGA